MRTKCFHFGLRSLGLIVGCLVLFGGIPNVVNAAKHEGKRVSWQAKASGSLFQRVDGNMWIEIRNGKVTKHRFYEYLTYHKFIELYDLKRHITLRLYNKVALLRWNFRPSLRSWVILGWGGWRHKPLSVREILQRKVRLRPASQPTSRPGQQHKKLKPLVFHMPSFSDRNGWMSANQHSRFQRIFGNVWRMFWKRSISKFVFLEMRRTPSFIELFAPRQKLWLRLTKNVRSMRRTRLFKPPMSTEKGRWSKKRPPLKYAWTSHSGQFQWQQIQNKAWKRIQNARPIGEYLWRLAQNQTYTELGNDLLRVRLYKAFAFQRSRKGVRVPWKKWKRVTAGHWNANPPIFNIQMHKKIPRRTVQKARTRPPLKRKTTSSLSGGRKRAKKKPNRAKKKPNRAKKKPKRAKKKPKRAKKKPKQAKKKPKQAKKKPKQRKDTRSKVSQTKIFPYGAVAFLRIVRKKGSKIYGTGVMIAPQILLTSAHLIYERSRKKYAIQVHAYPGLTHLKTPFGASGIARWIVHPRWVSAKTNREARRYDLAILLLKKPIGQKTGWLKPQITNTSQTKNATLLMLGYPLDKFYASKRLLQWKEIAHGHLNIHKGYPLKWHIPTAHHVAGGTAGAPLLMKVGTSWKIVGIIRGSMSHGADAIRISPALFQWIASTRKKLLHQKAKIKHKSKLPEDASKLPNTPSNMFFWEGRSLDLDALSK